MKYGILLSSVSYLRGSHGRDVYLLSNRIHTAPKLLLYSFSVYSFQRPENNNVAMLKFMESVIMNPSYD